MPKPLINKRFACAAAIMLAFIVYGSLFPFKFHALDHLNPLTTLLSTWRVGPEHFGNLIGNIFLYMPLGLFGVLAIGERIKGAIRLAVITAIGAALCCSMELTQLYDAGRMSTFADIYPNVFGTFSGAVVGLVAATRFHRFQITFVRAQAVPILLLGAFLGWRLFPYAPSLDLHEYWRALKPVVVDPQLTAYDIARYAVLWLVVAALGDALVGAARARLLLALAILCVWAAKVSILHNSLSAAELVGTVIAFVFWLALSRAHPRLQSTVIAAALAALVVAERLRPFHFLATGHAFGWIPFQSFIRGSMAVDTQSFLEKFFLYGGLIWMLTRAGARLGAAGCAVALGLLVTSALETHLPHRSAEITDALMALIIAGVFALIGAGGAVPDRSHAPSQRRGIAARRRA